MKNIKLRNKILISILFVICLFLFKNINQVKAAVPPYRWPIGGDNANETYMDYEYYGIAGQAPVKDGKSGREYKVNNKLWPNEKSYYAACESHNGMDITGINGHSYKVVSVCNGIVIATSAQYGGNPSTNYPDRNQRRTTAGLNDGGGYGNYIVIQEPSTGRCFLYAHLKGGTFKVSTGNTVKAGQELATMGSSGDSGHMHLHFEIRKSKEVTINTSWGGGYHRFQIANANTNLDPKDYIGSSPKVIRQITFTKPNKTQYTQGKENLNLAGAKLTVRYNTGIIENIALPNNRVKVTGFNNKKVGRNTIIVEFEGQKVTFNVDIIAQKVNNSTENKYVPAKREKVTFQRYFKYRQINIYFDKPVVLSANEPTVTVRVLDETKTAEYIGISDDGKKLMYRIYNNDFDIFTEGMMYVNCSGVVLDKGNINMQVNCNFNNLTIGKLYKCELKHTFSAIINNGKGDVTGDGAVDATDASKVLRIYMCNMSNTELDEKDKEYLDKADVNGDGTIDVTDASLILSYYSNKAAGVTLEEDKKVIKCDINSDNCVDSKDFNLLKLKAQNGSYENTFDLNEDGKLNNDDIEYFRNVMYELGSRKRS